MRINVVSLLTSAMHMYVCACDRVCACNAVLAMAIARKQALRSARCPLRFVLLSTAAILACLPIFWDFFVACRIKVENFYCHNYAYRLPNIVAKYYFDSKRLRPAATMAADQK